jgi:predicted TPR repeat methyltransferase
VRRAIDVHEGEKIDAPALKALIRAAVALNVAGKSKVASKTKVAGKTKKAAPAKRGAR